MRKRKSIYKKLALLLSFSLIATIVPVIGVSTAQAETDYGLHNPEVETVDWVWDTVYFGRYWQNDTNGDGVADQKDEKEPIRWRVLSMSDEEVFLLADQNLDCQPYNTERTSVTWETCTLRSWLNEEFLKNAFSEEEQSAIRITDVVNEDHPIYGTEGGNDTKDKVYLLSINEVMNPDYGFPENYNDIEARRSTNTKYAEGRGACSIQDGIGAWWLRSPSSSIRAMAADVYNGGCIDSTEAYVDTDDYDAVRPALHINRTSFDQLQKGELAMAHIKDPIATWDCVWFGNYWQDDTNGDGKADKQDAKQPIKWRVLSVEGDYAFLLADQNLDYQPYNTEYTSVTWETSTLRRWLNEDFLNNAFSEEEQSVIQITDVVNEDNPEYGTEGGNNTKDKVFLLSIDEVKNPSYGFGDSYKTETRGARNTTYANDNGSTSTWASGVDYAWCWWLRSPGCQEYYQAANVNYGGAPYYFGSSVSDQDCAVRPALYINLSSSLWSPAGKVRSSEGDIDNPAETPTETPSQEPIENSTPTPAPQQNIEPTVKPTSPPAPQKITTPAKVNGLKVKNNKKDTAKVSWKKVKTASGYQLQYDTTKKFNNPKKKLTKKKTVTIKKLKKKKTYYFRVRAYRTVDGKKVYGKWSSVKKVKIKK